MAEAEHPELTDLPAKLEWQEIVADGIVTLEEIEEAMAKKGYPPDSHDGLTS